MGGRVKHWRQLQALKTQRLALALQARDLMPRKDRGRVKRRPGKELLKFCSRIQELFENEVELKARTSRKPLHRPAG